MQKEQSFVSILWIFERARPTLHFERAAFASVCARLSFLCVLIIDRFTPTCTMVIGINRPVPPLVVSHTTHSGPFLQVE